MTSKQPIHIKWNLQLSSKPEQLWMYIADTNRLFRDLGLSSVRLNPVSGCNKKNQFQLSYNSIKHADVWTEEPAEWEYPYRYSFGRKYKNGPFRELKLRIDLIPSHNGTRLQYQLWVKPKHFFTAILSAIKYKTIWHNRLKKIFFHYDELIKRNQLPYQTRHKTKLLRGAGKKLNEITKSLIDITGLKGTTERLIDFICRADVIDLIRIKPYQLADAWQISRNDALLVFLHAANEGLLNFNWDLYCPSCRTIQQVYTSLNDVQEYVFCNECCSKFAVNFNQSVQLSFSPNPFIRKVSNNKFSYANPSGKPHVAVQQHLEAGKKRYVKARLKRGVYHLRISGSGGKATILVDKNGQDTIGIKVSSEGLNGEQITICCEPNLIFENRSQEDQTFILEEALWDTTGVTAARATSLQAFRDLFAHEVLRKGKQIGVDRLTLMFTDLLDSTAMYHKEGDDQAVGHVVEHFEILQQAVTNENGALVKTIGDSVMAVFSSPDQAFRAFVTAQNLISENVRTGTSLKLKAGIHHGSCVAVNLNNHIDYFGSTVNIASRLADLANENEVILSESVAKSNQIYKLLSDNMMNFTFEQEFVELKGFKTEQFDIKRVRLEKPHACLAI